MTREELIKSLTLLKDQARNSGVNTFVWDINIDGFNFVIDSAIEALEQEPTTKNLAADIEDAVERLNAIKQLIGYDKDSEIVKATQKSLDMAIKALEQEPTDKKFTKADIDAIVKAINEGWELRVNEILDKIRAEIRALSNANPSYWHSGDMVERDEVLEILDKYKAEQEE
jgi:hypothetical protein